LGECVTALPQCLDTFHWYNSIKKALIKRASKKDLYAGAFRQG